MTILTRLSENRKTTIKQIMREKGKTIYMCIIQKYAIE